MKLTDFTTLTFDMMGTLMDYEAGFVAWFRKHAAAGRADVADNQILEALARAEEVLQRDKPHPPFTRMLPPDVSDRGQRVLAAAGQGAGGILRRLGGGVAALSRTRSRACATCASTTGWWPSPTRTMRASSA